MSLLVLPALSRPAISFRHALGQSGMVLTLILWLGRLRILLSMSLILLGSCTLLSLTAMLVVLMLLVRLRFKPEWMPPLLLVWLLMFHNCSSKMLRANLKNPEVLVMSYNRRGRAPTRGKRYSKNWHLGGTRL